MSAIINPQGILTLNYPTSAKAPDGVTDVALPRSDITKLEVRVDQGAPVEYDVPAVASTSDQFNIAAQLHALSLGTHTVDAAVKTAEGVVGAYSAEFQILEAGTPNAPTISLA